MSHFLTASVPLAAMTTFRIGGSADWVADPRTADDILEIFDYADRKGLPLTIVGRGSNLLCADGGLRGVLLRTNHFEHLSAEGETLLAGAGMTLSRLAKEALNRSLSGLEWAAGIPGSLGGAVVMNAGAYGGEMADVVQTVQTISGNGIAEHTEHDYAYRSSTYLRHPEQVVTTVLLRLRTGDPAEIRAKMENFAARRRDKQPIDVPSAGSFWKRPPKQDGKEVYAAALVEQCGLKGFTVGDAMVSPKHAGFIVNTGKATCAEVLELARHVHATVLRETGTALEPEVRLLGADWGF